MAEGIVTNAGLEVSQKDREITEKSERNNEFIDARVSRTGTLGSTTNPKLVDKTTPLMPTFDQLKDTGEGDEGRPVTPIAVEVNSAGGFDYILTPYDYEMVKQGKVCARCLQWQADLWTDKCNFRNGHGGCGYWRNNNIDFNYEKSKIQGVANHGSQK